MLLAIPLILSQTGTTDLQILSTTESSERRQIFRGFMNPVFFAAGKFRGDQRRSYILPSSSRGVTPKVTSTTPEQPGEVPNPNSEWKVAAAAFRSSGLAENPAPAVPKGPGSKENPGTARPGRTHLSEFTLRIVRAAPDFQRVCLRKGAPLNYLVSEDGTLVKTYEGNPGDSIVPPRASQIKYFHLIVGPVSKELTRDAVLGKCRALLPEAALIVAQTKVGGDDLACFYHVGLQLPNPPKKRAILFQLHGVFPELEEDQLQLEGRSGWNRLRVRIMRSTNVKFIVLGRHHA